MAQELLGKEPYLMPIGQSQSGRKDYDSQGARNWRSLPFVMSTIRNRFGRKVNSHMIIALHIALLVQAPERSGWLPYLRMLPKKFDTMPVRYPPELLELLPQNAQGTMERPIVFRSASSCREQCRITTNRILIVNVRQ